MKESQPYMTDGRMADGGGDSVTESVLPLGDMGMGGEVDHNEEWADMPLPMETETAMTTHYSTDGSTPMPPMPMEPEIPRGTPTL